MSPAHPIQPAPEEAPSETAAELVAYLDGELDADAQRAVEEKLGRDEAYRLEMQQLQKAWDALECLPRVTVGDSFAATTVEMVALSADEDLAKQKADSPARRRRQWLLGAGGMAAAVALGFAVTMLVLPNANDELARDLPVLEHLDELQQVGDVESLRLIHAAGLFPDDLETVSETDIEVDDDESTNSQ
jgi:anti-sigma factor RsiW